MLLQIALRPLGAGTRIAGGELGMVSVSRLFRNLHEGRGALHRTSRLHDARIIVLRMQDRFVLRANIIASLQSAIIRTCDLAD